MPTRPTKTITRKVLRPLADFVSTEAGGGVLLLVSTVVALIWANSRWSDAYFDLWHTEFTIGSGSWAISEDLQHWVNDGLMALFFFLIGLEIKRELVVGELQDRRAAALPVLAAVGGMVMPAVIFLMIVGGGPQARGWGVPMATDIAFAIGVLALLSNRAPTALRLFLLTLAIVDDLGAIVIIAVFYSDGVLAAWLAMAVLSLLGIRSMCKLGVHRALWYMPIGVFCWYCTYRAGVHPTIAAVVIGLLTPAHPIGGRQVLEELEHRLHPLSSYVVVPIFALANAGVSLRGGALGEALSSRLTLAVLCGLVLGKTLGIFGATALGVRLRLGSLPAEVNHRHMLGTGALGGIGFTVALFIAGLAYPDGDLQAEAKIGILVGSVVSGALGALILSRRRPRASTRPGD